MLIWVFVCVCVFFSLHHASLLKLGARLRFGKAAFLPVMLSFLPSSSKPSAILLCPLQRRFQEKRESLMPSSSAGANSEAGLLRQNE